MGVKKFKFGEIDSEDQVGVVTGLAWTKLVVNYYNRICRVPGKGKLEYTGN